MSRVPTGAPPLSIEIAIVVGVAIAGIAVYWGVPRLVDLAHPGARWDPAVHARALGDCQRTPTKDEQLHIVVRQRRDGRLVSECLYVNSNDAHSRRP